MACRDIIENQLRPLLNEEKYEELMRRWGEIIQDTNIISPAVSIDRSFTEAKYQANFLLGIIGTYLVLVLIGTIFPIIGNIGK